MEGNSTTLQTIEVNPAAGQASASVIWMHGLGAEGNDFLGIIDQLGLPADHTVRFIFPDAPSIPITINGGMIMRGWFDLYDLELPLKEDLQGIQKSSLLIQELIQKEKELNIPEHRIVLAGFSQGGALALYTGLRFEKKLAAIISLSAYNPAEDSLNSAASSINAKTPILLAHGLFDPMVPLHMGKKALQQLTDLNYKVQWHDYPMQHTVSKQEIIDIGAFLRTVFELH